MLLTMMMTGNLLHPRIFFEGDGGEGGSGGGSGDGGSGASGGEGGLAGGEGGQGGGTGLQSTAIPDHIKNAPDYQALLKDIGDVENLTKSFAHAQQMVGKTRLPLPGSNAPKEEWAEFNESIGVPKTVEGYAESFKMEKYPEGVQRDESMESFFGNVFMEAGLRPDQVRMINQKYIGYLGEQAAKAPELLKAQIDEWDGQCREKFGDAYDKQFELGVRAVNFVGDEELKSLLTSTGLSHHPVMVNAMAKLGGILMEATGEGGPSGGGFGGIMDPKTAKAEIDKLWKDKDFTKNYTSMTMTDEKRKAMKRMEDLLKMAYPEKQESE